MALLLYFAAGIDLRVCCVLEGMIVRLPVVILLKRLQVTMLKMREAATDAIRRVRLIDFVHLHGAIVVLVVEAGRQRVSSAALHRQRRELGALLIRDEHGVVNARAVGVVAVGVGVARRVEVHVLVLHC